MPIDLVGRAHEIAELDRFLDAVRTAGPVGLVLEGPAGIGKSSLWTLAREHARARGILVLEARPSEAEATFAFQALADLLEPLGTEIAALPAPQRRSLLLALLREDPAQGEAVEMQAVATAASNVIRSGARRQPLLLAIDDAPWLDPASATALAFIVRRLADRPVAVLLAQRVDAPGPLPLELDRAVPTERLWLGPLGRGDLHVLLASRLGLVLPRASLARLHEESQGNPFHALEIARALRQLPSMPKPGEPLPVPDTVAALVGGRVGALPEEARRLLLVASLAGAPSAALLSAALGGSAGARPPGLDDAIDAGLVNLDGQAIRFSHPLIASTVVAAAGAAARREAHRALAGAVLEGEARARHLALASAAPDAEVARALEDAAREAERRGATEAAVELYRLAVDRTPEDDGARANERRVRLAIALFAQADLPASQAILDQALAALPAGLLKAEGSMTRATIAWYNDRASKGIAFGEQALAALGLPAEPRRDIDPEAQPELAELLGRIYIRQALFHDDYGVGHAYLEAAVRLLERRGGPSYASALMSLFWSEIYIGLPPDTDKLDRALALEEGGHADTTTIPALWWLAIGDANRARERLEWMRRVGAEIGDLSGEADLLTQLALVEVAVGDWPRARALIDEARMLAVQEGQGEALPATRVRALVDAYEGRLDEAEATAGPAAETSLAQGDMLVGIALLNVRILVAASRGDAPAVEALTARAHGHLASLRIVEPLRLDTMPDRVEALVALDRLADARTLLGELERRGRVIPRASIDAAVARGRALLALAEGDAVAALAATDPVLGEAAARWPPFERGRTLIVRGQVLRQLRHPREAGVALDEAEAIFERLGARAWAERARTEARRLGRRRTTSDELTPAERQVAELAASGLRNHVVADRLAISPKTVEAHLARVYAKLGIRSRAELGRAITPTDD